MVSRAANTGGGGVSTNGTLPMSYYFNSDGESSESGVRSYEAFSISEAVSQARADYAKDKGT